MLAYSEGDIRVNDTNIHYYRTGGDKPPFVLLHGMIDNGLCWSRVAELLARSYDVIMPDAQGHGLSARLDKDFTHENHAIQTVALIRELGLSEPLIMGHSMGAGTAVNIAIAHPSLPKAIILEDPAWITPPPEPGNSEAANDPMKAFRDFIIGLSKLPLEEVIAASRKLYPNWPEEDILPWASSTLQFDASAFSRPVINRRSYRELVPQIKCPTLLIIAESGLVTAETAKNAAALWTSSQPFRWVQIKGADHNIRREQFGAFCEALLGFLKEIAA